MSYLRVRVPEHIASILSDIPVPGTKVPAHDLHISLLYIAKTSSPEELRHIGRVVHRTLHNRLHTQVTFSQVTCFDSSEDGYPIIIRFENADLQQINTDLKQAFLNEGIGFDDTYPDFKLHITLSYHDSKIEDFKIPEMSFNAIGVQLMESNKEADWIYLKQ